MFRETIWRKWLPTYGELRLESVVVHTLRTVQRTVLFKPFLDLERNFARPGAGWIFSPTYPNYRKS